MIKTLYCQKCEKEVEIVLSEAGPHVKACCNECNSYIKFMSQTELKGETKMLEIFYRILDSKYFEGVFLEEFRGCIQLAAGKASKEGTNYKKWAFPQGADRKPGEKAIPVSVNLGPRHTAIEILEKMLAELKGSHGKEEPQKKTVAEQKSIGGMAEPDGGIPF